MQSAEHSGEGRFPGAVDARNGDDFSAACLKREIIQYTPTAETDADFLNGKQSIGSDCFHAARFGYRQISDTQSHSANIRFRQRLERCSLYVRCNPAILHINDAIHNVHQIPDAVLCDQNGLS